LAQHYQILIMFAAYFHQKYGIPQGQLDMLPPRTGLDSVQNIASKLANLERAVDTEEKEVEKFIEALASTQRISSRKIRFEVFHKIFAK